MNKYDTFSNAYYMMVSVCLQGRESVEELNQRTGQKIRALPGGASFRIDLSPGVLPLIGQRKTFPHVAAAETAWCLLGHYHINWLRQHTQVWDRFADVKDCIICEGSGKLDSSCYEGKPNGICMNCQGSGKTYWLKQAYGNRWRNAFGVDQLAIGLERLRADSSDRRVWISSWDPGEDIRAAGQKTVPCPVGFTLNIMGGKLNSALMIRSSDLYYGLPYDVMRHALVMDACAASLGVKPGIMRVTLAHPHVYERQWSEASQMLAQEPVVPEISLPGLTVEQVMDTPDGYVAAMKAAAHARIWPSFRGQTEVVA